MKTNTTKNEFIARGIPPFASGTMLVLALMLSPFVAVGGLTIAMLGGLTAFTTFEFIASHFYRSKLDRFFEDANIHVNGKLPEVIKKQEKETCVEYSVKMPPGMDTDDLQRLKLSIEQYLDASISITYKNGLAVIEAHKERLKSFYEYELVQTDKPLEIMIGYSAQGRLMLDLEDCPHLLVAGQTGSGKSCFLRSILTSLFVLKDVDVYLADFQRVELSIFKKCAKSFCSTPLEFAQLLVTMRREADNRLAEFESKGVAGIAAYNQKYKKMRYKIVCIDEFASLADKQYRYILDNLKICAAQFRKCGIHLIISTQRPSSRDIIDGTIKANIPVRVAFKTTDDTNSQIILDTGGAEDLKGKGNGLLLTDKLTEFQGMYLSEFQAAELIKEVKIEHVEARQSGNKFYK